MITREDLLGRVPELFPTTTNTILSLGGRMTMIRGFAASKIHVKRIYRRERERVTQAQVRSMTDGINLASVFHQWRSLERISLTPLPSLTPPLPTLTPPTHTNHSFPTYSFFSFSHCPTLSVFVSSPCYLDVPSNPLPSHMTH